MRYRARWAQLARPSVRGGAIAGCLLTIAALTTWPLPVRAGGELETSEAERRADRARDAWTRRGDTALPAIVRAVCSGDTWLESAAVDALRARGARSIAPLLAVPRSCQDEHALDEVFAPILCSAATEEQRAEVLKPLLAAMALGNHPRARAAIWAVASIRKDPKQAPTYCEGTREQLFRSAITPALGVLDATPRAKKQDPLEALAGFGAEAAPAVTRAAALVDDPRLGYAAISLLAAIGPGAAAAVPDLRRLLGTARPLGAARALGRIGPAAREALPDLLGLLTHGARTGCGGTMAPVMDAAAAIAGEREAHAVTPALVEAGLACHAWGDDVTRALLALNAKDGPSISFLIGRTRDERLPMEYRLAAARRVTHTGVPIAREDAALIAALERKDQLERAERSVVSTAQGLGGPSVRDASDRLATEWNVCRREVEPELRSSSFAPAADPRNLDALSRCLGAHTCGPTPARRAEVVSACCQQAFGTPVPVWCAP